MVQGLDVFRQHFHAYKEHFVIIGGVACHVWMAAQNLSFRTTKDFDIVLLLEILDSDFIDHFWHFIRAGKYSNIQKSSGKKVYYRFLEPSDRAFPVMIELFSRVPNALIMPVDQRIVPIPADEELSSLSAILMIDDYYELVRQNAGVVDDLPVLIPECLIALKAKAWLEMNARIEKGEAIDSRELKKHRNDIFRLSQILKIGGSFALPGVIGEDLRRFLIHFPANAPEWPSIIAACGRGYLPEPRRVIHLLLDYFSIET